MEWQKFPVNREAIISDTPSEAACGPTNRLGHVTHIDSAIEIIKRRCITPYPLNAKKSGDKNSLLKKHGIPIVFTSPRTWPTYIYGSVRFEIDWTRAMSGKNIYWIESETLWPRSPY